MRRLPRWLAALTLATTLSGCLVEVPPPEETAAPSPTYEVRPAVRLVGRARFALNVDPADARETDIRVTDDSSGEELGAFTVPDVHVPHYHPVELHNGNLYVIQRLGDTTSPNASWSDELWRYRPDGTAERLYTAQGIDFRPSPGEERIAVRYGEQALVVIDGQGRTEATLDTAVLGQGILPAAEEGWMANPVGWSADGRTLWLTATWGPRLEGVLCMAAEDWAVTGYDLSDLPAHFEHDLNPATGRLAYSDAPALFDADAAEAFQRSGQTVTLTVRDLATGQSEVVATAAGQGFRPRWVDDVTLEYDDPAANPDLGQRITSIVPLGAGSSD